MVEIKHVKLAPFTMMSSWIFAILSLIFMIIFVIAGLGVAAFVPQLASLYRFLAVFGLALIIAVPIITFMVRVVLNFISAGLYNLLVPRVGGIQLNMDGDELKSIPVVSFALILACVAAIWAFIVGVILAAAIVPLTTLSSSVIPVIAQAISNATNATTATIPTGAAIGTSGVVLALLLIIVLPICVFILGFIATALFAIFYNYIATRAAKVKLEFAAVTGTLNELTYIPVLPAAIPTAIVYAIFGLIVGLIVLVSLSIRGNVVGGLTALIYEILAYLIAGFIIIALIAIFYNFLQPKVGGFKLELE
jgi:hypothetical protein